MIVAQCDWCRTTAENYAWQPGMYEVQTPPKWLSLSVSVGHQRTDYKVGLTCSKGCALSWLGAQDLEATA